MKYYTYVLTFIILLTSCDKGNATVSNLKTFQKSSDFFEVINNKKQDINITGEWFYELNSSENELLNRTFQINIIVKDGILKGQYCAIAKNGNKIDCSDDEINNLSGEITGDKIKVKFFSFFGGKNGEAKISILNENSINWKITKPVEDGESYAPKYCRLTKK